MGRRTIDWAHLSNETAWPLPCEGMDELEWRLRYFPDAATNEEYLAAASIISAYRALVMASGKVRAQTGAELKRRAKRLQSGDPKGPPGSQGGP